MSNTMICGHVVNLAFSESGDSREYYGGPEFDLYESTVLK